MNCYDVLGVPPTADKHAIKKAYLRLVKLYHPDKCKDADSINRFNDVKTAYDVLSNNQKRQQYDKLTSEQKVELYDAVKMYIVKQFPSFNDIFQQLVKVYYGDENNLREDVNNFNFKKVYNYIVNKNSVNSQSLNVSVTIDATMEDRCRNRFKRITVVRKTVNAPLIRIVPLSEDKVVFKGCGETDLTTYGDLIVFIRCEDDPVFKQITSTDLLVVHDVTLYEYLYGTTVSLTHPDGEPIVITFSSLIESEPVFTFKNRGVPIYDNDNNNDNKRGDLYVAVQIKDINSDKTKNLIQSLFN